ncbi:MAG: PDZ domain-containing protein [Pirellulaceae bacterium]
MCSFRPIAVRFARLLVLIAVCGWLSSANGYAQADVETLQSMQSALTGAIENAGRSVVAIARVRSEAAADVTNGLNFNLPGMGKPLIDPTDPRFVPTEFASGVILSDDGDILTTFHALGDPTLNDYYVWHQGIPNEATLKAKPAIVQAGDPWTDLAVLRMETSGLRPIVMGDASKLKRGMFVISLGNPYAIARDGRASASLGIISNLQRASVRRSTDATGNAVTSSEQLHEFGTLIQTDARLNLGTSGGALVDLEGKMIGLTTSLAAVAGYEQSAGFAIPIDPSMLAIIEQLRQGKTPAFGFLGLEPTDLPKAQRTAGRRGAIVRQVMPGMPADLAGLRSGDLITQVDDQPLDDAAGLFREMSRRPANSQVRLTRTTGNPITNSMQEDVVSVQLGKKYLALSKPGYSRFPEPTWRGMRVDYGTAIPPAQMLGFSRPGTILPVAIISVDPDTPAWEAGLRPGQFVEKVDATPVLGPEMFHRLVNAADGAVEITILDGSERTRTVTVNQSTPESGPRDRQSESVDR